MAPEQLSHSMSRRLSAVAGRRLSATGRRLSQTGRRLSQAMRKQLGVEQLRQRLTRQTALPEAQCCPRIDRGLVIWLGTTVAFEACSTLAVGLAPLSMFWWTKTFVLASALMISGSLVSLLACCLVLLRKG